MKNLKKFVTGCSNYDLRGYFSMLNIVVALPEEARPLIDYFKLKRWHDFRHFAVYRNNEMHLIVSGIGKIASATAAGFLAGLKNDSPSAWLNIGIAGGDAGSIGDIVLANEIVDSISKYKFYPSICFKSPIKLARVITVTEPCTSYFDDAVFDMEASGFYGAALRFSTTEMVHSVKIISDNSNSGVEGLVKTNVSELIERNLTAVSEICCWLHDTIKILSNEYKGDGDYNAILSNYHFTFTQRRKLKFLLQKWYALTEVSLLQNVEFCDIHSAKMFLKEIERQMDKVPITYIK